MQRYDILVVGAGPAGSSAAREAAKAGCRVLMVEKKMRIGLPVQCAEYIARLLLAESRISSDSVIQGIDSMVTHLPDGGTAVTRSPGYMIDRAAFDRELAASAQDVGAEVLVNTRCVSRSDAGVLLKRGGEKIVVASRVIIGADGARSTVGEWMGSTNEDFITGLQYALPLKEPLENTEVYFRQELFGGYGWLFPKGGVANVGIGVKRRSVAGASESMQMMLDAFANQLESAGRVRNVPVSVTGGSIPVGGPLASVKGDMMLVGDAAGQTDAITGGGVPQAVICGRMAGKAAARAVLEDDTDILMDYEREWQGLYGRALRNALEKRHLLESRWGELESAIKKYWVAFEGHCDARTR
ncbi:MAG: NAD(P)/FAD-dependent oxidoreductase [Euryarchaeota archaeon]|nr:NAD(P)/FAD-dependent oxidoreductase [Euryarchaeota archaeon]